jgi:hypothetical protein
MAREVDLQCAASSRAQSRSCRCLVTWLWHDEWEAEACMVGRRGHFRS